jgi:ribosomal protein S18 acetylase RimI-like enzyme
MVGVHPNFSGKGIGRELIKICILFAKESDEKIIALHTSEFMNSARHLYEDLGFVMNKELKPIFDKKYWLYLLKL